MSPVASMLLIARLAAGPAPLRDCPRLGPIGVRGTQVSSDELGAGRCYASIHPRATPGLVYRSYLFAGDGMLMVFSSYGEGDESSQTSARVFYVFPRARPLSLDADAAAGTVSVRMTDGARFTVDPDSAQLAAVDRGYVTVSPRVDPQERGGVEFPRYAGLMLDAGFRRGGSPSGRPDGESTFRDARGTSCAVENREIFLYADGEHALKFADAELSVWLKTRCPGLEPGF